MAPLDGPVEIAQVVATVGAGPKYSETVDKESAHEIITARLAKAHAAAATAAADAAAAAAVATGPGRGSGR